MKKLTKAHVLMLAFITIGISLLAFGLLAQNASADITNPHPTPPANSITNVMLNPSIINPNNINEPQTFSFLNVVATSTTVATTTVTGEATLPASTTIGAVGYRFPSSQGGAGTQLQDNGSGTLSWASPLNNVLITTYVTGENLAAGTPVYIADGTLNEGTTTNTVNSQGNDSQLVFGTVAVQQVASSFVPTSNYTDPMLSPFGLCEIGTAVDNALISIEADNAGAPSGTPIIQWSVSGATLTTSCSYGTALNVTTHGTITSGTTYWLVLGRSGSNDNTNRYQDYECTTSCAGKTHSTYNGSSWSSSSGGINLAFSQANFQVFGQVYETSANTTGRIANYIGLSAANYATGTTATIDIAGLVNGMTGLATSTNYYVGNTLGTLSTSAGGTTVKACHAISPTQCLLTFIW